MKTLTIQEGLVIQKQHLDEWQTVLTPEAFGYVKAEAERQNRMLVATNQRISKQRFPEPLRDGFDVWRGCDISGYIGNMAMNGGKPREF